MKNPDKKNTISSAILVSVLLACSGYCSPIYANAQSDNLENGNLEEVVVIGVSPLQSSGKSLGSQFADQESIEKAQALIFTDFLDQNLLGVTINQAQNNPLQPDLQYRGFAASPALGLQQGLTVYQNGVRINEPFGDTVNWDLLPKSTIAGVQLVSGVNPVFGLNSLGGSLVLDTKTGFNSPGNEVTGSFGSFARQTGSLSFGGNSRNFGHFVSIDYWNERGWRDFSASDATNIYGALSWRFDNSELDIFYNHGDTDLRGNGASPVDLIELNRAAVFTHPDRTENNLDMINVVFKKELSENQFISTNVFYRANDTSGFNGDGSTFEACEADAFSQFLCFEDDDDDDNELDEESDVASLDDDEDVTSLDDLDPLFDQNGELVSSEFDAINNLSERRQRSFGANVEYAAIAGGNGIAHNFIAGASYLSGRTRFSSQVEVAGLNLDRSTSGSGLFDPSAVTDLNSDTETVGIYLSDTIQFGDHWQVAVSGRYNTIEIESEDLSGIRPALNDENRFSRLNIGVGATYTINDSTKAYFALGQSTRSPSPVELACSQPDAPCTLPNTFLADPPLEEVVSTTFEAGINGVFNSHIDWKVGVFHITNQDDIIFQTTGGVSSNVGFFDNVSDTQRVGLEARVSGVHDKIDWYVNYTYLRATFEDSFISSSPNHPLAEDGGVFVNSGSNIPGLPEHNLSLGVNLSITSTLSLGVQGDVVSGQYLRGDEANLLDELNSYVLVDMNFRYQVTDNFRIGLEVENIFEEEFNSFGLLGEPDEIFEEFTNPVFVSSSAPRGAWINASFRW